MKPQINNILGLDVGDKRIGVARVNTIARLPEPLEVLQNNETFTNEIEELVKQYDVQLLVIGLPRSLNGNETAQTNTVRLFVANKLKNYAVQWQDETLSSVVAEAKMREYGLTDQPEMLDAVAACIILEDYISLCV